jgi:hypothetical protein
LKTKDPKIVNAHNVIGMAMRKDGRSNHSRSFSNQLQPQFRPGIDNHFSLRCSDQNTRSHATISGIV